MSFAAHLGTTVQTAGAVLDRQNPDCLTVPPPAECWSCPPGMRLVPTTPSHRPVCAAPFAPVPGGPPRMMIPVPGGPPRMVMVPTPRGTSLEDIWRAWTLQGDLDSIVPLLVYIVVGVVGVGYFIGRRGS